MTVKTLSFSNGVRIDASQIVTIESNQQTIQLPGGIGELEHLLQGRPAGLLIHLSDGSTVEINAGQTRLRIQQDESQS